jgi:YgiT-type zinc finger domain-containing protein
MRCLQCKGDLERGTTTYTDTRNGYVIVLNEVPAWVCRQCGEALLDADAVRGIQQVLVTLDEGVSKLRHVA